MTAPSFISHPAEVVGPRLLGWRVRTRIGGEVTELRLTEVEAYSQDDPASHSFGGPRGRNRIMYGPPGRLYVYRSYGVHWCANVVCGPPGVGAAVLMRAGTPLRGIDAMIARRGRRDHLADGPGNLTAALGIDVTHNGTNLFSARSPIRLLEGQPPNGVEITRRIGISKAVEVPWRFVARS
ncbi:MAG: DNA-3-methyladenine glycosylase [Acidimicrobiia bacterium]